MLNIEWRMGTGAIHKGRALGAGTERPDLGNA